MALPQIATGQFNTPSNAFSVRQPPVPCHVFEAERQRALAPIYTSRMIDLDLSTRLGLNYPATTPTLMARYITLAAGQSLPIAVEATAEIFYVAHGRGVSTTADAEVRWKSGDVFALPGGGTSHHQSIDGPALLLLCTDEPLLAFLGVRPREPPNGIIEPTLFCAEDIEARLEKVHAQSRDDVAGKAVFCTTPIGVPTSTVTPMIVGVINTLEAGGDQRAHRHNAVALTLCIQGENCHSIIEGERVEWRPFSVMLTPPTQMHSHHNRGSELMRSFVMQDSGLYYQTRAVGFAYSGD